MFDAAKASLVALLLLVSILRVDGQIIESHIFSGLNRNIPDGSAVGLSDVRSVTSAVVNVSSVQVKLYIAGQFNGDLYGYVRHVGATCTNFCVLLNRPGRTAINPFGYQDDGFDITFDNGAENDVHNYELTATVPVGLPLTGIWKPDGRAADPAMVLDTDPCGTSLSSFTNGEASGEWTLFLADLNSGATNVLLGWELNLSGNGHNPTTISLASSANPSEPGQPVLLTASVSADGTIPEGIVLFCDDLTVLSAVNLSGGQAEFMTSALGVGSHTFTACYMGTADLCGSTNILSQIVSSPLEPMADQTAHVLMPFVLTNLVINSNWLSQPLTFGLGDGAPDGACVGTNGVFYWTPGKAQARSTNIIDVWMTDSSLPPISATNTFVITVDDYLELALGRTVMLVGQTSSVPVTVTSSVGLTNLEALIQVPKGYLTSLALTDWAPETANATLQQKESNVWQMNFVASSGQPFQATQQLANLRFFAVTNGSAFVPLVISEVTTNFTTNGDTVWRTLTDAGRVAVIEQQPLLEALPMTNGSASLTLFGVSGPTYDVLFSPVLPAISWQLFWTGNIPGDLSKSIAGVTNTGPRIFFRVRAQAGDLP
jgi:hypothetical protein